MKKKDLAEITYSENKEIINADSNSKKTNNSPTYPLISSPISIESNIQINDNISQSSNFPSPTFTESNNSQVNEEASSNLSNTPLSIVDNDVVNDTMNNSKPLNSTSEVIYYIINNYNSANSEISTIPQTYSTFSNDSLNNNNINININNNNNCNYYYYDTSLSNGNSQVLYYSIPVTIVSSSNYPYYSIENNQTSIPTAPMASSPSTIYYTVNTPTQQPMIISSLPTQQTVTFQ